MAKILCMIGMALAGILLLLFVADAATGLVFGAGIIWDALFLVCSGLLGWIGWTTFREQV